MSVRKVVAVGIGTTCLALVAGCGSSSSGGSPPSVASQPPTMSASAYKHALHQVGLEETRAQHQVENALHANTVLAMRAKLVRFGTVQTHAATQLIKLKPPLNAVTANTALATALTADAKVIRLLVARLAHVKSVSQAARIIERDPDGQKVGREIDAALKQLKQLGYTSGH